MTLWDWCIGSGNWHRKIVLDFLSEIYYYAKGAIINRNMGERMWKTIFLGQKNSKDINENGTACDAGSADTGVI